MKGNCETCTWWQRYRDGSILGYCSIMDSEDNKHVGPEPSLAVAFGDHKKGKAYLQTHATFGCVQWEPKQEGRDAK